MPLQSPGICLFLLWVISCQADIRYDTQVPVASTTTGTIEVEHHTDDWKVYVFWGGVSLAGCLLICLVCQVILGDNENQVYNKEYNAALYRRRAKPIPPYVIMRDEHILHRYRYESSYDDRTEDVRFVE